jgi:hypothetical protein
MLSTLILSVLSLLFWSFMFVLSFIEEDIKDNHYDLGVRFLSFIMVLAAGHTVYTMYWG